MPLKRPSAVTLVIAVYAVLVISVLGITPLWLDELWGAGRADMASLVFWVQINPGGVPLPYLIQKVLADVFGNSAFVLRLPAAVCSIAAAGVFAALCTRFGIRSRAWATALFLALPLQFRYALEARGYSMGLLCALISLWLFLRVRERGTVAAAVWYGASVALGLYSQPLSVVPVCGELLWLIGEREVSSRTRRMIYGAALIGALTFVPWYIPQHQMQEKFATMSLYSFSWRQVAPLRFLHELSGGGYVCTAALLLAAGLGFAREQLRDRRLLASVAFTALAGPIAVDALVNYFFAARQLLFAVPVLVLCGAAGVERLRGWTLYGLLAVFFIASAVADFRLATVPKDNFGAQARVLAANLPADACVMVAPPNQVIYYLFMAPQLEHKVCAEPPVSDRVLAVMSPYSTAVQQRQLTDLLDQHYDYAGNLRAGTGTIAIYRRR